MPRIDDAPTVVHPADPCVSMTVVYRAADGAAWMPSVCRIDVNWPGAEPVSLFRVNGTGRKIPPAYGAVEAAIARADRAAVEQLLSSARTSAVNRFVAGGTYQGVSAWLTASYFGPLCEAGCNDAGARLEAIAQEATTVRF